VSVADYKLQLMTNKLYAFPHKNLKQFTITTRLWESLSGIQFIPLLARFDFIIRKAQAVKEKNSKHVLCV